MVIRNAASAYQKTQDAGFSAVNAERAAFELVIRELEANPAGPAKLRALGRNHTLWSILVQDLSLAENALPDGLKTVLINLGLWAMRYSTLAMLKPLPLEPLIDVNRNLADGLQAQQSGQPASAPASSAECLGSPISA
jgi:flagellar protein FlaF